MGFLKEFLSADNKISEDNVMGFLNFIAMVCAAFIPGIGIEIFFGFMSCMLLFFGKSLAKKNPVVPIKGTLDDLKK